MREIFLVLMLPHRLLKGTLHQWSRVLTVDAVTGDSHQVATTRHCVAKQSQVTVVNIGAVEGDDVVQLPLQSLSHCLNPQHLKTRQGYTLNIKKLP